MTGIGISLSTLLSQALQPYAGRTALVVSGDWNDGGNRLTAAGWTGVFDLVRRADSSDGRQADEPSQLELFSRQLAVTCQLSQRPVIPMNRDLQPTLALGAAVVVRQTPELQPSIALAVHCDRGTGYSTMHFNELRSGASVSTSIGAGLAVLLRKTIERESLARWNFDQGCRISQRIVHSETSWREVVAGDRGFAEIAIGYRDIGQQPRLVLPGAFNPLHQGHLAMAGWASRRLGAPVAFEMSISNAEKKPLDFIEIDARSRQAFFPHSLLLTNAATFDHKAKLFPGATFIVGVDTIMRIADPKYYANQPSARDTAIDYLAQRQCRFLVFGRLWEGQFCSLSDVPITPALRALAEEVPESEFRADIASTHLRT